MRTVPPIVVDQILGLVIYLTSIGHSYLDLVWVLGFAHNRSWSSILHAKSIELPNSGNYCYVVTFYAILILGSRGNFLPKCWTRYIKCCKIAVHKHEACPKWINWRFRSSCVIINFTIYGCEHWIRTIELTWLKYTCLHTFTNLNKNYGPIKIYYIECL